MDVGKGEVFVQLFYRQDLPQDVGVPALRSTGDVIARVGNECRLALKRQRHFQRFVRGSGQTGIMKLMALVPHIGRHLVGDLLRILLICRRLGYGHDTAARHRGIVAI